MKCVIEMFHLAHGKPCESDRKAANRERRSSEDYVNVACDLDEYLREHECSVKMITPSINAHELAVAPLRSQRGLLTFSSRRVNTGGLCLSLQRLQRAGAGRRSAGSHQGQQQFSFSLLFFPFKPQNIKLLASTQ